MQLYVEKCLSPCLLFGLFVTFLPKAQCLSLAKNFNSPSVGFKKITMTVIPPDRDFSELSPRKQPPSPRVRESDRVQFIDGDCVIV